MQDALNKVCGSKMNYIKEMKAVVELDDFTDGEDATGYVDLYALPAGALVLGWKANITTAFAGTTAATMQIGVSGDVNRFSADTSSSIIAAAVKGSLALAVDAAKGINAAATPRVTITDTKGSDPDFGDFTAGKMEITIYYIN